LSLAELARALEERLTRGLAGAALVASTVLHPSGVPERFADFLRSCEMPPSEVVEAIADASEGRCIVLDGDRCESTFGCGAQELPRRALRTVLVRAGGRAGKTSRLLAPKAIHAAFTVPLPTLATGEHARAVIIAPDKDLAAQALAYVRGILSEHPILRGCVVEAKSAGKGDDDTVGSAERVTIRRPHDGKFVDIRIGAATRGGKAVRGKTLVFVGMDEACFFYADNGYAVTDAEIYRAAIQRVVPGGQVWLVSTPWIEGYGVLEERLAKDWGRHEHSLCAVGPTRALNPTWDPDGEIERDMRETDPDNASREIDAVPLPAGTKMFFSAEIIKLAVNEGRAGDLEPILGRAHYAGTDLGFRRNSSALAIARSEGSKITIAFLDEKRPERGAPLKPSEVVRSFATSCARYQARTIAGDLHYADTAHEEIGKVREEWRRAGHTDRALEYVELEQTVDAITERFAEFRRKCAEGLVDLPKNARLLIQMRLVTSKAMPSGAIKIELPKIAGAHGDLLGAVVNAATQVPGEARGDEHRVKAKGRRQMAMGGGF
jgi:hypothetical protein